jgi:RNA polymerase sigma factor (sigma-70 family)
VPRSPSASWVLLGPGIWSACRGARARCRTAPVNIPRRARRPLPEKRWHVLLIKGPETPLPHLANGPESPPYEGPMNRNQKIAAALGLSLAQVGLLLHAPASPRASTPVPGADRADLWREERPSPLSEFVGDPSHIPEDLAVETLSAEAALRSLARSLTTLPARQRVVLAARYGLGGRRPETLQDLADKLGISREGVRQLQSRAEVTLARCRSLSRAS